MKKLVYLMSLVALLFCYSCNSKSSESGGKKEKLLSLCEQGVEICQEGIDRMRAAEYPEEFMEICEVYERRLDKWEDKVEETISEREINKLYESDDEVAKAADELKIIETKFHELKYRKKREFGIVTDVI